MFHKRTSYGYLIFTVATGVLLAWEMNQSPMGPTDRNGINSTVTIHCVWLFYMLSGQQNPSISLKGPLTTFKAPPHSTTPPHPPNLTSLHQDRKLPQPPQAQLVDLGLQGGGCGYLLLEAVLRVLTVRLQACQQCDDLVNDVLSPQVGDLQAYVFHHLLLWWGFCHANTKPCQRKTLSCHCHHKTCVTTKLCHVTVNTKHVSPQNFVMSPPTHKNCQYKTCVSPKFCHVIVNTKPCQHKTCVTTKLCHVNTINVQFSFIIRYTFSIAFRAFPPGKLGHFSPWKPTHKRVVLPSIINP